MIDLFSLMFFNLNFWVEFPLFSPPNYMHFRFESLKCHEYIKKIVLNSTPMNSRELQKYLSELKSGSSFIANTLVWASCHRIFKIFCHICLLHDKVTLKTFPSKNGLLRSENLTKSLVQDSRACLFVCLLAFVKSRLFF